jgi:hypothetical protein
LAAAVPGLEAAALGWVAEARILARNTRTRCACKLHRAGRARLLASSCLSTLALRSYRLGTSRPIAEAARFRPPPQRLRTAPRQACLEAHPRRETPAWRPPCCPAQDTRTAAACGGCLPQLALQRRVRGERRRRCVAVRRR